MASAIWPSWLMDAGVSAFKQAWSLAPGPFEAGKFGNALVELIDSGIRVLRRDGRVQGGSLLVRGDTALELGLGGRCPRIVAFVQDDNISAVQHRDLLKLDSAA